MVSTVYMYCGRLYRAAAANTGLQTPELLYCIVSANHGQHPSDYQNYQIGWLHPPVPWAPPTWLYLGPTHLTPPVSMGTTNLTPPILLGLHPLYDGLDGVCDLDTLRTLKEELSSPSRAPTVVRRRED